MRLHAPNNERYQLAARIDGRHTNTKRHTHTRTNIHTGRTILAYAHQGVVSRLVSSDSQQKSDFFQRGQIESLVPVAVKKLLDLLLWCDRLYSAERIPWR